MGRTGHIGTRRRFTKPGTYTPVASVLLTPSTFSIGINGTQQLVATPKDVGSNALVNRVVNWSSNNTAIATVNAQGIVTGFSGGTCAITATCESKSALSTATVIGGVSATVSTLTIAPSTITAGGTGTAVTVTAKDGVGLPVVGATVVLAVTGTGNSVIQPVGVTSTSGVAQGTITSTVAEVKTVSATANSIAILQTAAVTVQSGAILPAPWYELTYEAYANTAAFLADLTTFTNEDVGTANMELVTDAPAGLGLTKSWRARYDATPGNVSQTIGRNINLPSAVSEVWVEVYLKWSANFDTHNAGSEPAAHKVLFGRYNGTGRWEFDVGQQQGDQVSIGYPDVQDIMIATLNTYTDIWLGTWQRWRFHWKVGTGSGLTGRSRLWQGNTLWRDLSLNVTNVNTIYGIALGRNQDDRNVSNIPMYLYWNRLRVWNTDPGWT